MDCSENDTNERGCEVAGSDVSAPAGVVGVVVMLQSTQRLAWLPRKGEYWYRRVRYNGERDAALGARAPFGVAIGLQVEAGAQRWALDQLHRRGQAERAQVAVLCERFVQGAVLKRQPARWAAELTLPPSFG